METHSLGPVLREHPFFQGLAPAHIDLLVGCASNVRFTADTFIAKLGDPADRFYIIRTGKAALEVDAPGKGAMVVQTVRDGDILGSSWLFPPYHWNFDVRVVEVIRAIALDAKCLRTKCEQDHDLGYEMMKKFSAILVDRLRATRLQLIDMYTAPAGRGK
jgi:CRP-like cAMP-binding protein